MTNLHGEWKLENTIATQTMAPFAFTYHQEITLQQHKLDMTHSFRLQSHT